MRLTQRNIGSFFVLSVAFLILASCRPIEPTPTVIPSATPTMEATASPTSMPTKTPAPLTPLPTDTPTMTPTPVIYVVKKGDNLLSIAKQYGVTAEAIQEANGILDPRRLQIGQELVIPMDESALKTPPTPTATPMPYEILGITFQRLPSGRLWCLGEIENTAGVDLEQVQVAVSLFDEAGTLLAFSTAYTESDMVPKGARAPFVAVFDNPPETFATYQSVPLKGIPVTRQETYVSELEIVSHTGEARGPNSYSVSGRLRNAGDRPTRDVRVLITAYDAAGNVVAVRKVAPEVDELLPGRSTDFQINLLATAGAVVTYTLRAEGLEGSHD